jgi:hypothetical protein
MELPARIGSLLLLCLGLALELLRFQPGRYKRRCLFVFVRTSDDVGRVFLCCGFAEFACNRGSLDGLWMLVRSAIYCIDVVV